MEKIKVKSEFLKAKFGESIDYGFTSVPNVLLDYGSELGLSDRCIYFIIRVLRASFKNKNGIIKNTDISDKDNSTLFRIKKELEKTKLVIIKTYYEKQDNGKIIGYGTMYDFRPLFDELYNIAKLRDCKNAIPAEATLQKRNSEDCKTANRHCENATPADKKATYNIKNIKINKDIDMVNFIQKLNLNEISKTSEPYLKKGLECILNDSGKWDITDKLYLSGDYAKEYVIYFRRFFIENNLDYEIQVIVK